MYSLETKSRLLLFVILAGVVLLVFGSALTLGHVPWDDNEYIFRVKEFQHPSLAGVLRFWTRSFGDMYLPVTYTLVSGIAGISKLFPTTGSISGLNPHLFHLVNLVFHFIVCCFVFLIIRLLLLSSGVEARHRTLEFLKLKVQSADLAAFLGTLLFAVHPTQVEPVVWISGIKDLAYGIFAFPATYLYLQYLTRTGASPTSVPGIAMIVKNVCCRPLYWTALFLFLLAILAKPAAVTVPVVAWFLSVWILRFPVKRITIELSPWLILSLPIMIVITRLQSGETLNWVPPLWSRPLLVGDTTVFYLNKLIFPLQQGIIYNHTPEVVLGSFRVYLTWIVPFGLTLFFWFKRESLAWIGAGYFVFTAGFLTVSGLVPFIFQNLSAVADRYLYLSMLGPAVVVGWIVYQRPVGKVLVPVLTILCLLSVRSAHQTKIWGDPLLFLKHNLTISNHPVLHRNLGKVLMMRRLPDETIAHFGKLADKKITVTRESRLDTLIRIEAHLQLGFAHNLKNNLALSYDHYLKAVHYLQSYLKLFPGDYRAMVRLGNAYCNLDMLTGTTTNTGLAMDYYRRALGIEPDLAEAHYFLASNYLKRGDPELAARHFKKEIKINPDNSRAHHEYGLALLQLHQPEKALYHFNTALSIHPDNSDYHQALSLVSNSRLPASNSADFYLNQGHIHSSRQDYEKARNAYQQALKLNPNLPSANYLIAVNLRKSGRLKQALPFYRKELKIAPNAADVHNDMGIVLFQLGKLREGIQHIEAATQINPEAPVYRENLKQARQTSGIEK